MTNCLCTHSGVILCLFPLLLHNSGNKHRNNPLVSAETVRHSSMYIILYQTIIREKKEMNDAFLSNNINRISKLWVYDIANTYICEKSILRIII